MDGTVTYPWTWDKGKHLVYHCTPSRTKAYVPFVTRRHILIDLQTYTKVDKTSPNVVHLTDMKSTDTQCKCTVGTGLVQVLPKTTWNQAITRGFKFYIEEW